ncbi:MAG: bifunctional phosphoribosylaminoimidazolecarboxamide formyltransferase/IMP cyclohydrolase [SAR202 cluster bacterium]|nr:bifunctional phosphoribosylaminoimidazolecarboxamide formyltransferase/IMP cyclohydrolase [SAR202 cluster bacterium]|tara:strand:+ start:17914 stop:19464 length:1551 start_codon:yes stop_codon:yes gene_type:complete
MKAIISVSNKDGLKTFAKKLLDLGFEIISTGGTKQFLEQNKIPVTAVSDITQFPEILNGRVKTLHPAIHGGILSTNEQHHTNEINKHGIEQISLVIVNLYPFLETIKNEKTTFQEALENIDIGGPTMVRAAAKNFSNVIPIIDPEDYPWIIEKMQNSKSPKSALNCISLNERKKLAVKAFEHISVYDATITNYLKNGSNEYFGRHQTFGFIKTQNLRYGENPHQTAAVYSNPSTSNGIVNSKQLHGIEMSFNNYLDADAAIELVSNFDKHAVVVVKHNNPCGLSINTEQSIAYEMAYQADPVSAFGGIVGFNSEVTEKTALAMKGIFFDVIVAPKFSDEALEILKKRKKSRIVSFNPSKESNFTSDMDVKLISGGALIQIKDNLVENLTEWKNVTKLKTNKNEFKDATFAWTIAKYVKSNAIVLVKENTLLGMGAGQPNRVSSLEIALKQAGNKSVSSILASDAFIPFPDTIDLASKGKISCIIQPGGSIRDKEVIEKANELGIKMIFTGIRHFRH